MIVYKLLTLSSDLDGFQCDGVKDDQFVFDIPDGRTKVNGVNYVMHALGEVFVQRERYSFTDTKSAGMTSNDAPFTCPDPGKMYYTVISDAYRYYCISYKDKSRPIVVTDLKLQENATVTIPTGNHAFLAVGSIIVDNQTYTAPTQLTSNTSDITVTASSNNVLICQFSI